MRTVFFDAGNTLIYPDYSVIQKALAEFGVESNVEKIRQAEYEALAEAQRTKATQSWKVYFGIWLKLSGAKDENLKEIYSRLWERHRQKNLWSLVDEAATHTLSSLKNRGYRLGVISNSDGNLAKLLQDCGLAKFFEVIIDSSQVGFRKPDPAIFEFAVKEMKSSREESLFVGDSYEIDVLGAENAGLTAILYDPLRRFESLECLKINQLTELLHYCK